MRREEGKFRTSIQAILGSLSIRNHSSYHTYLRSTIHTDHTISLPSSCTPSNCVEQFHWFPRTSDDVMAKLQSSMHRNSPLVFWWLSVHSVDNAEKKSCHTRPWLMLTNSFLGARKDSLYSAAPYTATDLIILITESVTRKSMFSEDEHMSGSDSINEQTKSSLN